MNARTLDKAIIALGIFLLVFPFCTRALAGEPLLPGGESYGHLRIAETITEHGIPANDPALPERAYTLTLFDGLLAAFVRVLGPTVGALLLPFLLGLGTLAALALTVRRWKIPAAIARGIMLVFVLSPLFVAAFTQASPRGLELLLFLLYLLALAPATEELTKLRLAGRVLCAAILAAALATFGVVPAIAAFSLPLLVRTVNHRVPHHVAVASVAAFITLITVALPAYLQSEAPAFAKPLPVVLAISDFGGAGGMSVFAWLLAFIGLVLLWQFTHRYYALLLCTTLVLAAALLLPTALVTGMIAIAFLAGYALAFFARMEWSFEDIRTLTLLVLACGLLFSTLAHAMELAHGQPTAETRDAALALRTMPAGAILAHPDDGFWYAYWSGKQVWMDGWLRATPRVNERWTVAQQIWHAQDIMRAQPVLARNRIGALVITDDMREGKVWDLPEQDLLFLLRNNETFKSAHRSSSVDIWTVLPSQS